MGTVSNKLEITCHCLLTGMPFAFKEAGFGMGIILLLLVTLFTGKLTMVLKQ